MKKIVLLLIFTVLTTNCVMAQSVASHGFKNPFGKTKQETKIDTNAPLTANEQATILYNDNNAKSAMEVLLNIKEADRTAQDWLLLGNILQDQEKTSDAIFMYQRAISVNPKLYKTYYNLGNIYLSEDKFHLAIDNYKLAAKNNPEFAYTYYNMGCAYLKLGELKKAKITFLKAVELKNTVADFHYNLAYTYKMLKKPKLSKQYLDNYNNLIQAGQ